jgi:hypothetical protein
MVSFNSAFLPFQVRNLPLGLQQQDRLNVLILFDVLLDCFHDSMFFRTSCTFLSQKCLFFLHVPLIFDVYQDYFPLVESIMIMMLKKICSDVLLNIYKYQCIHFYMCIYVCKDFIYRHLYMKVYMHILIM